MDGQPRDLQRTQWLAEVPVSNHYLAAALGLTRAHGMRGNCGRPFLLRSSCVTVVTKDWLLNW